MAFISGKMFGSRSLTVLAIFIIMLSAMAMISVASDASDADEVFESNVEIIELTDRTADVEMEVSYGSLEVRLHAEDVTTPKEIRLSFATEEFGEFTGIDTTVNIDSDEGSRGLTITVVFNDVLQLPDGFTMYVTDPPAKDGSTTFRLSVSFTLVNDNDVIITKDTRNYTRIAYRAYGDKKVSASHQSSWFMDTSSANTDITVRNMSLADKSMKIVFDGATVKKLTFFALDTKDSLNASNSVEFHMYSGSIQTLALFSITNQLKSTLGSSYDVMNSPLHDVSLDLRGGTIDLLNPCSIMVSIANYDVSLYEGMSVNKLYTTGENGKFTRVSFYMNGAHVGYMSNIASRIGAIDYYIQTGKVDYLCIGANTEHISTRNLENMATSYITGSVTFRTGSTVEVGKCIMGAGILNMPRLLSNGDRLTDTIVHTIIIDAVPIKIYNDSAFFTERRTSAYHFTSYKIGQNPYAYSLMDSFNYKNSSVKVYSVDGVWTSISSASIPFGGELSLNTDFFIQSDGTLTIQPGGRVFNSDQIILCGSLVINGELLNNSVIQCRPGSTITGKTTGMGFLADYVHYSTPTSSLNVMSQRTAVVIDQDVQYPVESISSILSDDRRSVTITIEGSQRIYGDSFMISLDVAKPPEEFDHKYRLDVKGIDTEILGLCTVDVTLPTDNTVCTAVYVLNEDTGAMELLATSEYESEISFTSGKHQEFYLLSYMTDRPELPQEPEDPQPKPPIVINTEMTDLDYFLIAAIVAVLAVTIYALVTMKRD